MILFLYLFRCEYQAENRKEIVAHAQTVHGYQAKFRCRQCHEPQSLARRLGHNKTCFLKLADGRYQCLKCDYANQDRDFALR